jgi:hypothetical protein
MDRAPANGGPILERVSDLSVNIRVRRQMIPVQGLAFR